MEQKLIPPLVGSLDAGAIAGSLVPEFKKIVERKMDDMTDSLRATLEDGKLAASRTLKRTRYAALDELDELEYKIKRQPLLAVTAACAVGVSIGLLLPMCFRNRRSTADYYQ